MNQFPSTLSENNFWLMILVWEIVLATNVSVEGEPRMRQKKDSSLAWLFTHP